MKIGFTHQESLNASDVFQAYIMLLKKLTVSHHADHVRIYKNEEITYHVKNIYVLKKRCKLTRLTNVGFFFDTRNSIFRTTPHTLVPRRA